MGRHLLSRRSWLQVAGLGSLAGGAAAAQSLAGSAQPELPGPAGPHHGGHAAGTVGRVSTARFDPTAYLRSWNFSHLPEAERARFYRETLRPDGTRLREYEIFAVDREIEIAPGVFFPAWTYNSTVPGPVIRATEGDILRVTFLNAGSHPHTIHFHGIHPAGMDGVFEIVGSGEEFTYEFPALPYGMHLYHCHSTPLKKHIHKGLYGAFIIDPAEPRAPAQELVLVMNGYDTDGDGSNNFYTVNGRSLYYARYPITVKRSQPVRIYLANLTEFDLVNSFHLHANFFRYYPTGSSDQFEYTDTVMQCQGQRGILEIEFSNTGTFMFHAHQSEFAELGWMGFFDVVD